ncbi:MAG: MBL fold metallo-hydrolase [Kutzneria sp.]|nr:MBL fold metallo-hydrolase [Kutzneria sp.]MBV9847543.1 MBL fold metallo-hydrolase [Kutzneria sp.]
MVGLVTTTQNERLRRPAVIRSLCLGDTKVSYVPDGAVQLGPRALLPDTTDEVWAAHPEYLDDSGNFVASIGGLLVERGDRALLIDAGFGPQTVPAQPDKLPGAIYGGALLDNLAALGRHPSGVEAVAFTHLHVDHLGWAWHPAPDSDRPAFTSADYLISEPEWAQRRLVEASGTSREIVEALRQRVRTVTDGEKIFPGVHVRLAPGHTTGHATYAITGSKRQVIAFGDALHSPIQVGHPEWSAAFDHDPEQSARFRHALLTELAESDTIGFGVHFADVVFGRVHADGSRPAWCPVED